MPKGPIPNQLRLPFLILPIPGIKTKTNKIIMLENSIYSILSPEGFASILYKDGTQYEKAAKEMKITAKDLKELGVIDEIIKENNIFENTKKCILKNLQELKNIEANCLVNLRYEKYRVIGNL